MKMPKYLIVASLMMLFTSFAYAQEQKSEKDTTLIVLKDDVSLSKGKQKGDVALTIGNYKIDFSNIDEQKYRKNRYRRVTAGLLGNFQFGVTNLTSSSPSSPYAEALDLKLGFHYGMDLFRYRIRLDNRNDIKLNIGVNGSINDYVLNGYTLIEDGLDISPVKLSDDYKKSKLSGIYLGVPLSFTFEIGPGMYIEPEVAVDFLLYSYTKYKHPKVVTEFSGLRDIAISTTLRFKFDWFGFYIRYSPTSLFESSVMPEVMPYSFGVVLF